MRQTDSTAHKLKPRSFHKSAHLQVHSVDFHPSVNRAWHVDRIRNGEVTRVAPLEIKINSHKQQLEAAVMDLDRIDMFLGHDWLVKHNTEVNWKNGTIRFTKYLGNCAMKHKDIRFKTRRTKAMETTEQNNGKVGKEPNKTNPEDLPEYIQPFMYLFNKKKFEKLLKRWEWDHEINLMEEAPKKLNTKAYAITLKEEEALNQ